MDSSPDVVQDFRPLFRVYRDGRVDRLMKIQLVPPSDYPETAVRSKDVVISPEIPVSARLYLPKTANPTGKLPLLIYIHGGAFSIESAFSTLYHNHLISLAEESNAVAVSVEYRLAPEHQVPACYEDVWTALQWVAQHATGQGPDPWLNDHADFERVFLVGDSAGANIGHNIAIRAGLEGLGSAMKLEGLVFNPLPTQPIRFFYFIIPFKSPSIQMEPATPNSSSSAVTPSNSFLNQIPTASVSQFLNIKLEGGNFMVWKNQILNIVYAHGLDEYLEGTTTQPAEFLDEERKNKNPEYQQWNRLNRLVMSWLYASLSAEPLGHIVGLSTAADIWTSLKQRYESASTARVMSLRSRLQQLSKGGNSIAQYLSLLKSITDQLAAIGEPISYRDHLGYLLEGLPAEYDPFVSAVYNRADNPSIEEVQNLLVAFDHRLERRLAADSLNIPQAQLNLLHLGHRFPSHGSSQHSSRNQSPNYRAGGLNQGYRQGSSNRADNYRPSGLNRVDSVLGQYPGQKGPRSNGPKTKIKCQICYKLGHSAAQCYHRLNLNFQAQAHFTAVQSPTQFIMPNRFSPGPSHSGHNPLNINPTTLEPSSHLSFSSTQLSPNAHLQLGPGLPSNQSMLSSQSTAGNWFLDSGATHHLSSSVEELQSPSAYQGPAYSAASPPRDI